MTRPIMRSVAVLVLLSQAACSSVHVVTPSYVNTNQPNQIWVTRGSGAGEVQMYDPRIEADTLFGLISESDEIAVPVSDVRQVRAKRFDLAKTSLLVGGILAIGIAGAVAAGAIGEGNSNPDCVGPNGLPIPNCTPMSLIPLLQFRIGR
jgi:hypothetical protein